MAKTTRQDVFGSDKSPIEIIGQDAIEAEKHLLALTTVAERLKKELKDVSENAKGLSRAFGTSTGSNLGDLERQNTVHKEAIKLLGREKAARNALGLTQKEIQSAEASLQRQRERGIAQMTKEAAKVKEAERPYTQLGKALNEAKRKYQDMATAGTASRKEMDAQMRVVNDLRGKYEGISKAVGNNQFAVGRYENALGRLGKGFRGVTSLAGQFGATIGGIAFLNSAKDTIVQFDNSIADLSAITGLAGKDLDFFKKKSVELGINVKGGAKEVVEAYKLIASAKPELLDNAAALNEVTEAAILLSRASGMELPAAATALTDAMNQFGASSDEASKFVDVLAAGAKFGSAEIPQITDALLRFGAVAKTANVSVQESTALIEDLAEKGLKGADAGTALRNVMLKLNAPDALGKDAQERLKAMGINFADLSDKNKSFAERLEILKPLLQDNGALVKVFGTENAVAATTLLSTTDRIKELTTQVNENGVALEQAQVRSKTLSEAYNRFKETINGLILEFTNGVNAASGLAGALDFLSRNMGTIVTVAGKLLMVFAIYKARMIALSVVNKLFADGTGKINLSLGQLKDNMKNAGSASSGLGSALRGVGWSAIIGLVVELGSALYDVATGADKAASKMEAYERLKARLANTNQKAIKDIDSEIKKQRVLNETLVAQGKISEKEGAKRLMQFIKEKDFETGENQFDKIRNELSKIDREIAFREADIRDLQGKGEFKNRLKISGREGDIRALKESKKALYDYNAELKLEITGLEIGILTEETATKTAAKSSQVKKKTRKSANDEIQKTLELLKKEQELLDGAAESEFNEDLSAAIRSQQQAINEDGVYSLELINKLIEAEKERKLAIIERQYAEETTGVRAGSQEEANAELKRNIEIAKANEELVTINADTNQQLEDAQIAHGERMKIIRENDLSGKISDYERETKERRLAGLRANETDEELERAGTDAKIAELEKRIEAENDYGNETLDLEIELAELRRQERDKEVKEEEERQKYMADLRKKSVNEILDELKRESEEREKMIDKEISDSERLEERLIEAANAGSDTAADSLAAQKEATAEKLTMKEQEQKKQEAISRIQVGYEIFESLIEKGESVPSAGIKTVSALKLIQGLLANVKGFYTGTKRTVGEELGAPLLPGKDGHVIRVDGSEKILNPELSRKTGNATTDEIVEGYLKYDTFRVNNMLAGEPVRRVQSDMSHNPINAAQLRKLDIIAQELRSLPREYFSTEVINGVLTVCHNLKKGNDQQRTYNKV